MKNPICYRRVAHLSYLFRQLVCLRSDHGIEFENSKQVESDFAANRHWNRASQALNWLNMHHNRGKKGLGFVTKHTIYPVNTEYVSLPKNIMCFHCGKTGHYRYACLSRMYAMNKNLVCKTSLG